jgi:hypothetical protein
MNNTGRHGVKSGYLVILLLVVGLTAFSHSMKELTEIHHLTMDASRLVAQWSGNVTPAEVPQTTVQIVKVEKHESCESRQSAAPVELPWLDETETEPSDVAPVRTQKTKIQRLTRPAASEPEIARLKKLQRIDIDADEFEVRIPNAQFPEAGELPTSTDVPEFTFKAKARKHGTIRISPRDREILLKTLNRSINLRIAS